MQRSLYRPFRPCCPTVFAGITPDALTVTVDGRAMLVIPREQMLDLMVRIGVALREVPAT